jgi:hypothetical protein
VLCFAVAAVATLPSGARADDSDTQQWSLLVVNKNLLKRWRAYFEIQPRFGEQLAVLDKLLVRPAIGYRLNGKLSLWQGYGWTPGFRPRFGDEHRFFQQFLYEDKLGGTSIVDRARLEERLIAGTGGMSLRFRNMIRVVHPISRDHRWLAIVWDEVFVHLNTLGNGPEAGFDQNRFFAGVGRDVNRHLRVETGYLLNNVNRPRTSSDRTNNVWLVQFTASL